MATSALLSSKRAVHTRHLTASELAGYVDHALDDEARRIAEDHLDHCQECRDEAMAIMTVADSYEANGERVAMQASATRHSARGLTRWRRAVVGLGAIAAGFIGVILARQAVGRDEQAVGVRAPQSPSRERETAIAGAAPADGATIAARGAAFSWHPTAAEMYRFTLLMQSGEPVWSREVTDTTVTLPVTILLEPGRTYFWRVDAIADGIAATSGAQRLQVAP